MSPGRYRLLLVEDDPADALLIESLLQAPAGKLFYITHVTTLADARAALDADAHDVVLLDLHLPDSHGWPTFERLADHVERLPVVVLSGLEDEELADRAVRQGAQNYLIKGETGGSLLCRLITHAIERHRIQRALAESEARFRVVVEQLADALVIVDADATPLLVNRAARALFGDDDAATVRRLCAAPEDTPLRLDGEPVRLLQVRRGTLQWDGREVSSVLARDVTAVHHTVELRARVEAAQQRSRQLEELNRLKSEMVAKVTHELRTPMTPLRSIIDLLLQNIVGPLNAEQRELIGVLGENVDRLSRFATQMLTTARLDSVEDRGRPTAVRLPDALDPIVALLQRGEHAEVALGPCTPCVAWVDMDDLVRVVTNLVSNAVAHNTGAVQVRVSARPVAEGVEICVEDDGQGVPAEHREVIFDRFVQLKRRTGPGYRGTGLGLSICRAIVQRAGGWIRADASAMGGAAFTFHLPAPPEDEA